KISDHWHRPLLRMDRKRPHRRAPEQRDDLAPFQLVELHSVPSQGRIGGYRISEDQSGGKKAPAIDGRGKLAERLEVEFGPFRSASRLAECFLVALPPVLGSSAPKVCSFGPGSTSAAAYPGANSFLQSFFGRLPRRTE